MICLRLPGTQSLALAVFFLGLGYSFEPGLVFAAESDVQSIWTSSVLDHAKTPGTFGLNTFIQKYTKVCGGTNHECDGVGYFGLVFNTYYWEYEVRKLRDDCTAHPAPSSECDRWNDAKNDILPKLGISTTEAVCTQCDSVNTSGENSYKPFSIVRAFGVLIVPSAALDTPSSLPTLVSVGFGGLSSKLTEAKAFVKRNNSAVFVIVPPGDFGNFNPISTLNSATESELEQDITLARANTLCNATDGSLPLSPEPCLFFRDLEDWDFPGDDADWLDAWQANSVIVSPGDPNTLPFAGPLEFQSSDFHDLADADPKPEDSWFFRAVFAMMRAVTVLKNMPSIPDAAGSVVDGNKIGIAGNSRGGLVALMVNALDDRLSGAIVGSAAGYFQAGYDADPEPLHVDAVGGAGSPYGDPSALATCSHPARPDDLDSWNWSAFHPYTATGAGTLLYEETEVRDHYWPVGGGGRLDCSLVPHKSGESMPTDCRDERRYDPTYNDDSAIKETILAGLFCDHDFDAALSVAPVQQQVLFNIVDTDTALIIGDIPVLKGPEFFGVNYAQIDRRTCALPTYGASGAKQERELTNFLDHFDPAHYLNGSSVKQRKPVLLVSGAQDEIFPINTVTATFDAIRDAQPKSVLQMISNWDHPAWYGLVGSGLNADDLETLGGPSATAGGIGGEATDDNDGFAWTVLGGNIHHPMSDFFNKLVGDGAKQTASPAFEVYPRVNSQTDDPGTSPRASVTTDRFFDLNVAGTGSVSSFPLPVVTDYDDSGSILEIDAEFDTAALVAGGFLPSGAHTISYDAYLAISFDRGWTYNATTFYENPFRGTYGGTGTAPGASGDN